VIFCHGTPWSSQLWSPFAEALAENFTVHLWDMPGYGSSSMDPEHEVSLNVQGELLVDLVHHWGLHEPHIVAHDFGGAVALRAHLLHGSRFSSLALVDVVALTPWGSDFFNLVHANPEVFAALPPAIHQGLLRAYIAGASSTRLTVEQLSSLAAPWTGAVGQAAFYRQIAQADETWTRVLEPLYGTVEAPVLVIWGTEDQWIPVNRAVRLASMIPGAQLKLIPAAGHLIQLDQPVQLATALTSWLTGRAHR
jgi:pimeloyl-ACP methyl ester carboxylesterase